MILLTSTSLAYVIADSKKFQCFSDFFIFFFVILHFWTDTALAIEGELATAWMQVN